MECVTGYRSVSPKTSIHPETWLSILKYFLVILSIHFPFLDVVISILQWSLSIFWETYQQWTLFRYFWAAENNAKGRVHIIMSLNITILVSRKIQSLYCRKATKILDTSLQINMYNSLVKCSVAICPNWGKRQAHAFFHYNVGLETVTHEK